MKIIINLLAFTLGEYDWMAVVSLLQNLAVCYVFCYLLIVMFAVFQAHERYESSLSIRGMLLQWIESWRSSADGKRVSFRNQLRQISMNPDGTDAGMINLTLENLDEHLHAEVFLAEPQS